MSRLGMGRLTIHIDTRTCAGIGGAAVKKDAILGLNLDALDRCRYLTYYAHVHNAPSADFLYLMQHNIICVIWEA